jgi:predicted secreted protein
MKACSSISSLNALTLFLLLFFSLSLAGEPIIITKQDQNREIIVKAGTVFQIQLEEKGGTGYAWEFEKFNSEYFELIKVETKNIAKKEGCTGNPIIKIWHLKAIKKGPAELTMYYYRPWEDKNRAADKFHIRLKIM